MAGQLSLEQRQLLMMMGGWQIAWALIDPDNDAYLWQSCWSGSYCGHSENGRPEWMTSFRVESKQIVCPSFVITDGPVRCIITKAQLRAYARDLDPEARTRLIAARDASRAEQQRTEDWCRCGRNPPGSRHQCRAGYMPISYHPPEWEWLAHHDKWRENQHAEDEALRYALGLAPDSGPLELDFTETSAQCPIESW